MAIAVHIQLGPALAAFFAFMFVAIPAAALRFSRFKFHKKFKMALRRPIDAASPAVVFDALAAASFTLRFFVLVRTETAPTAAVDRPVLDDAVSIFAVFSPDGLAIAGFILPEISTL